MENARTTVKLILEYDGTCFSGWQIQKDKRTVQGELHRSLHQLTGENIRTAGAGRTDTGVHALGQVASFTTRRTLPVKAFRDGLNALLPEDIRILDAQFAENGFHARHDAVSRTYRYVISKNPVVVGRHYCWYPMTPFRVRPMMKASRLLLGEHDFSSFSKTGTEPGGYFKTRILDIRWMQNTENVYFQITAVRFFHHMVRILVGTLMQIGISKMTIRQFKNILDARDRTLAGPTAPPQGLFLLDIHYDTPKRTRSGRTLFHKEEQ